MTIDLGVGAIIIILALLGLASGFWSQILRLGALASLFFIAPPVAQAIESPVGGMMSADSTPKAVEGVSLIAAAVGLYLIMSLVIFLIMRAVRGDRPMSGTNRVLGLVLGAIKGGALCYLVLAGLVLVSQSRYYSAQLESAGFWADNASDSKLVGLVSDYNILAELDFEPPPPEAVRDWLDERGVDAEDLPVDVLEGTGQAAPPDAAAPESPAPTAPGTPVPPTGPGGIVPTPGGVPIGPGTPAPPGTVPAGPGGQTTTPGQPVVEPPQPE